MRARGTLLAVVKSIAGQSNLPTLLLKAVDERISTRIMPIFGDTVEEELGTLSAGALQGA